MGQLELRGPKMQKYHFRLTVRYQFHLLPYPRALAALLIANFRFF